MLKLRNVKIFGTTAKKTISLSMGIICVCYSLVRNIAGTKKFRFQFCHFFNFGNSRTRKTVKLAFKVLLSAIE